MIVLTLAVGGAGLLGMLALVWQVRKRHMDRWLGPYVIQRLARRARTPREVHVLLCIADHFEPQAEGVSAEQAQARVARWVNDYPRLFGGFRDSDGRAPRHTFFYPIEMYEPAHLDALAVLCRQGFGEVEVHLHHDKDTAETLRETLRTATRRLADRHGLLARSRTSDEVRFGFIHGNWALDNADPEGRFCGVNNELDVLREAGCYADFTLPSAPSPTQTRTINSLYYAIDDPSRPKSHDRGLAVGSGRVPERALMLIQGPLVLDWRKRRYGVALRVENGCLQASQPPSIDRLDAWLRARVQVASRPDWFFVKLHAHGAPERDQETLLGPPMIAFHQALARRAAEDSSFFYHYVTARELYNLAKAAESGWRGGVGDARDFALVWDGVPDCRTPSLSRS